MFTPPAEVEAVCAAFAPLFTRPSWRRAQALLCGVLLAPANHALTAALRALGLADDARFQNYHRLLQPGPLVSASSRRGFAEAVGRRVRAERPADPRPG